MFMEYTLAIFALYLTIIKYLSDIVLFSLVVGILYYFNQFYKSLFIINNYPSYLCLFILFVYSFKVN